MIGLSLGLYSFFFFARFLKSAKDFVFNRFSSTRMKNLPLKKDLRKTSGAAVRVPAKVQEFLASLQGVVASDKARGRFVWFFFFFCKGLYGKMGQHGSDFCIRKRKKAEFFSFFKHLFFFLAKISFISSLFKKKKALRL